MNTNTFETCDRVFNMLKEAGTDIDVKLLDEAAVLHLKLEKELDIRNFIKSVEQVSDYKTIRKSVTVLNKKHQEAEKLGVKIEQQLIQEINECA